MKHMLVDAGKENYGYTDHVRSLNVILSQETKNGRNVGHFFEPFRL